ncbi:MAG TPA: hypothetical protein VD973_00235, partial [Symbiobacteriaceae bacterium]|nr:hypothetical protein [Symbiobacteriaceae bacterium]
MERPLTRFFRHWMRTIAAAILLYFLPMAVEFWLYSPGLLVPRAAAAATMDNPWGDLPDWVVLQPFPAGFHAQPKSAAWADKIAFADATIFTLRNPAGDDLLYEEAGIAYAVKRYEESTGGFGGALSVGSRRETVPQGQYQYTWSGSGFSEGLYHWSYEYTPVQPPACVGPECPPEPDPGSFDPISEGGFPVIYDKTAPEIIGL